MAILGDASPLARRPLKRIAMWDLLKPPTDRLYKVKSIGGAGLALSCLAGIGYLWNSENTEFYEIEKQRAEIHTREENTVAVERKWETANSQLKLLESFGRIPQQIQHLREMSKDLSSKERAYLDRVVERADSQTVINGPATLENLFKEVEALGDRVDFEALADAAGLLEKRKAEAERLLADSIKEQGEIKLLKGQVAVRSDKWMYRRRITAFSIAIGAIVAWFGLTQAKEGFKQWHDAEQSAGGQASTTPRSESNR